METYVAAGNIARNRPESGSGVRYNRDIKSRYNRHPLMPIVAVAPAGRISIFGEPTAAMEQFFPRRPQAGRRRWDEIEPLAV